MRRKNVMKINKMLLLLFVFSAGCVMGMEENKNKKIKSYLIFELNKQYDITGYFRQNIDFSILPTNCLEKNIFEALLLEDGDRKMLKYGFSRALEERTHSINVPYSLKNEQFMANICVINKINLEHSYLMKITKKHEEQ
jgi:hypothetical protein